VQVVAVHNNFIIGHAVKKQRFIDHSLWFTTTAQDLSPSALEPSLAVAAGKHRHDEKTEQEQDNPQATRQEAQQNEDWHPEKIMRQEKMRMKHDRIPMRHPEEELCTISVLFRTKDVWFVSEEPIDLSLSLRGAVVGASYSLRLAISESQVRAV